MKEKLLELNPLIYVDNGGKEWHLKTLLKRGQQKYMLYPEQRMLYGEDGWAYALREPELKRIVKVFQMWADNGRKEMERIANGRTEG
jgi:hypothetical protein